MEKLGIQPARVDVAVGDLDGGVHDLGQVHGHGRFPGSAFSRSDGKNHRIHLRLMFWRLNTNKPMQNAPRTKISRANDMVCSA